MGKVKKVFVQNWTKRTLVAGLMRKRPKPLPLFTLEDFKKIEEVVGCFSHSADYLEYLALFV